MLFYIKACQDRLDEIKVLKAELAEEEQRLTKQLQRIEGDDSGPEPATWREKLNAFAQQRNAAFTYHQAADYLKEQGWHNKLDDVKLKGSVAATLARLASNGDYRKIALDNGTNYGLPEWFEGEELKKDKMP